MNIKQLNKAAGIIKQIEALDAEIIEIDKMAMLVADSETKISLRLKVDDLTKKETELEKVRFDGDGSIIPGSSCNPFSDFAIRWGSSCSPARKEPKPTESIFKQQLTVTVTMQVLGVLLAEKQAQRLKLTKTAEKLGVKI